MSSTKIITQFCMNLEGPDLLQTQGNGKSGGGGEGKIYWQILPERNKLGQKFSVPFIMWCLND